MRIYKVCGGSESVNSFKTVDSNCFKESIYSVIYKLQSGACERHVGVSFAWKGASTQNTRELRVGAL